MRHVGLSLGRGGRALLAVVLILPATGLMSLMSAAPASANVEKTLTLHLGQQIVMTYNDLVGDDAEGLADAENGNQSYGNSADPNSSQASNSQDPSDCQAQPGCDDIPIVLDVPKSDLAANNNLFFAVSFTYNGGPGVTAPGGQTQTANTVEGSLWENPIPTKGPNADNYDQFSEADPVVLNIGAPQVAKWNLVADNITGYATSFKLTIALYNVGNGPVSQGQAGRGSTTAPPASSPPSGTSSSSPAPTPSSSPPAGTYTPYSNSANLPTSNAAGIAPAPDYPVLGGGPNPELARLANVDIASALGFGAGQSLRSGSFLGIPASRPASTLAVVLALVTTPALLLVGGLLMARRRRGQLV
ncbi:MAG: hypothetical protein ACYCZV_03860 [Acidimicrobiales bacterium]